MPQRGGQPRGPQTHDGTITTERPDLMWGTDMTTTVTTDEGTASVFVAVDHCTCECVGIHAAAQGNRFEALEPIYQGVRERFGAVDKDVAVGLQVRHDHGSAYMSVHFQTALTFLGIESSPSFVRAPEGNGCSERFIRTLKENLLWVTYFATIEELRMALIDFMRIYNEQWILERMITRHPTKCAKACCRRRPRPPDHPPNQCPETGGFTRAPNWPDEQHPTPTTEYLPAAL